MNTIKIENKKCKIIAHRGLSGLECENTNAAFVAAGNRSYFGIETDVHVTKDGKYIIIHDNSTKRVSDKEFDVEKSRYKKLKKVRLYDKIDKRFRSDLTLPDLTDYIRICKKYEKIAVLEIKNPMSDKEIVGIINEISGEDYLENTIFISFEWDNLVKIKSNTTNLIFIHFLLQYITCYIVHAIFYQFLSIFFFIACPTIDFYIIFM